MTDIINLILFYGFFLGLTLAIGNLSLKKINKSSDYYTFSIFMVALWLLNIALFSTQMIENYEYFSTALLPFSYIGAASQFVRYKSLVSADHQYQKNYIFYTPAIVAAIAISIPIIDTDLNYSKELLRFNPIISYNFSILPLYYKIIMLLYPFVHIYHVFLISIPLIKTSFIWRKKYSDQKLVISKLSYLCAFSILLSSVIAGVGTFISLKLIKVGLFLGNNSMLLTFVFAIRYPEFKMMLHEEIKRYSYIKSKIKSLDINDIMEKLKIHIEQNKSYAIEGITIKEIASALDITVHQLSEILNNHLGKNFNSFINYYRIEEAKKLLINEPELTIIEISGKVGFSSSSIFSTVFSKTTGYSPRDYRKLYSPKNKK